MNPSKKTMYNSSVFKELTNENIPLINQPDKTETALVIHNDKSLIDLSSSFIYCVSKSKSIISSVSYFAYSLYNMTKKYLFGNANEFEIVEKIKKQNIHASLQEYSWSFLFHYLTNEEVKTLVTDDFKQYESFDKLYRDTSHNYLENIIKLEFIDKSTIKSMLNFDNLHYMNPNIARYHRYIDLFIQYDLFPIEWLSQKINDFKIQSLSFRELYHCDIFYFHQHNILSKEFCVNQFIKDLSFTTFDEYRKYIDLMIRNNIITFDDILCYFRLEFERENDVINFIQKYRNNYLLEAPFDKFLNITKTTKLAGITNQFDKLKKDTDKARYLAIYRCECQKKYSHDEYIKLIRKYEYQMYFTNKYDEVQLCIDMEKTTYGEKVQEVENEKRDKLNDLMNIYNRRISEMNEDWRRFKNSL